MKILCSGAEPRYTTPWVVGDQEQWLGSGCIVSVPALGTGVFVATNAHVVDNAFHVHIRHQSFPMKFAAKTLTIAPELDLALLSVSCPSNTLESLVAAVTEPSPQPMLFEDVVALGYGQGGETICATKGVLSRVDVQMYAYLESLHFKSHSIRTPTPQLIYQIDAAINNGNSGGPAFDAHGRLLGLASSAVDDAQNVGYVIPTHLVNYFLHTVSQGTWPGLPWLGCRFRTLQNPHLRSYLGMDEDVHTGVEITEVAPASSVMWRGDGSHRDLPFAPGQVLLSIDGHRVSNEGTVPWHDLHLPLFVAIHPDKEQELELFDPTSKTLRVVTVVFPYLRPRIPSFHGVHVKPEYVVLGGLVFTRLSQPLLQALTEDESTSAEKLCQFRSWAEEWCPPEKNEIVVLLRILDHPVNDELLDAQSALRLEACDGEEISSLGQLAQLWIQERQACATFVKLRLRTARSAQDIVLCRSSAVNAEQDILQQNGIHSLVSPSLLKSRKRAGSKDADFVGRARLCCA